MGTPGWVPGVSTRGGYPVGYPGVPTLYPGVPNRYPGVMTQARGPLGCMYPLSGVPRGGYPEWVPGVGTQGGYPGVPTRYPGVPTRYPGVMTQGPLGVYPRSGPGGAVCSYVPPWGP